jgi:diguanylate cyclase (GGDEF)-like protein
LRHLATTDGLTGLLVRRHFRAMMTREVQRARRFRRPLSIIMLDIDDFKQVNDRYGHPVGDHVLRVLSRIIRARGARDHDLVSRYGGEEFVIGSLEADKRIAVAIAERLRQSVEQQKISGSKQSGLRVTISLGVASFPDDAESLDELIENADRALYHAKRSGKNHVGYFTTGGVLSLAGDRTRKTQAVSRGAATPQ